MFNKILATVLFLASACFSISAQVVNPGSGSSSGSGSAFQGSTFSGPQCPVSNANHCFFANWDLQYAYSVTCNSTTTIVTAAADPPFTSADIGKLIVGKQGGGSTANCPPQTTITGFTDGHTVTVANAATVTGSGGALGWGHNDGAAIAAAFADSLGRGCLYLPQGAAFFDVPPFLDQRTVGTTSGPATCVIGSGQTLLTPLQTFNYANCITNGACVFTWPNGGNQNPNYAFLKDFEIFGMAYNLTGTGTNNFVMNLQRVTEENVWVWHWGNSIGIGKQYTGPVSSFDSITDTSGGTNCFIAGSGGGVTVQMFTPFCGEGGISIQVNTGAFLETFGGGYGPGFNAEAENVNGTWASHGEWHLQPASTNDTIRIGATGNLVLDDSQIIGANSNTLGAIDCNGSGGKVQIRGNTVINGGTGGIAIRSVAGCIVNNASGGMAKVTQGTFSLSGINVGQPAETQTGTCSANAATVTFVNTYSVAPLVNVSDTTSGSTGAQATATSATTATIHCNGATDTFVATVIPNPI